MLADGLDEDERVDSLGLDALHEVDEVLGDDTAVHRVEASALQLVAEVDESLDAVLLTTLAERAAPSEDRSDRVGGSLLAGEVLVVVTGDGAVGSLVLVVAIGADEDRGHHGERTEGGGDHVAHDVAIVVLASPDEAALAAYYAGNSVVDEGVEILQASLLELLLVALLIDLVEDDAELSVVLLGDGVLGSEPEILVHVERVGEASVSRRNG